LLGKSTDKDETSGQAFAKSELNTEQNLENLTEVETSDGSELPASNAAENETAAKESQGEEVEQKLPSNSSTEVTVKETTSYPTLFLILGGVAAVVLLIGGWIMMRSF
jgi:cobalamin biosynthesis Mg chelatase CobN